MKRLEVRFSEEAERQFAELHPRRQGMLKGALGRVAASAPEARFVQARTTMDVAGAEVIGARLVVYAVMARRDVLRRIWGSEFDQRLRSREIGRLIHGRGPSRWSRSAGAPG